MSTLNSVRHVSVLLLAGFVAYFSFSDGITLFAWHPPFMVIGFLLLMTEAIMVFSSVRVFKQKLTNDERLDIHTLVPISACIFIGIGFFAIYCSKVELNHEHYQSAHSNIGYLACISSAGASMIGILARFGGNLKLPVNLIKTFHAIHGTFSYSLAIIAICLGLNSFWLKERVAQTILYGLIGVVLFIGLGTVFSPIRTVLKRVKSSVKSISSKVK